MKKKRNNQGITLIALVITIIILIILAGVSINLVFGQNGLINRAQSAGEQYNEATIREKVEMELASIYMEKLKTNSPFTIEDALQELLNNGTFETIDTEAKSGTIGEYVISLGYNENGKVVILEMEKDTGVRIKATINPKAYTNGSVQITIEVKTNGEKITQIEVPEEMKKNSDGIYEVSKNGTYLVKVTLNNGQILEKEIKIDTIDTLAPKSFGIEVIDDNVKNVTITAQTEDSESDSENVCSGISKYVYYIGSETYETNENSITITTLEIGVEYTVYVIAYDNAGNTTKTSEIKLTPINVLEISTLDELKQFRDDVNNGNDYKGATIELMADIDLKGDEKDQNTWWTPIGNNTNVFSGKFNGNNHTISNLYISNPNSGGRSGFFGCITGAEINNLRIKNGYVYQYNGHAGMLIGLVKATSAIITNCTIEGGRVQGDRAATVVGYGGIIGYTNSKTEISNCINSSAVSSNSNTGGIIGASDGYTTIINECVNMGQINNSGNFSTSGILGASMGYNIFQISNCYNMGNISSENGDVAGITNMSNQTSSSITNSYNVGNLSGIKVGGIIVELEKGTLNNNYWQSDCGATYGIYETSSNEGATRKTKIQMQSLSSSLGEAYTNDAKNINGGYPILKWQLNDN